MTTTTGALTITFATTCDGPLAHIPQQLDLTIVHGHIQGTTAHRRIDAEDPDGLDDGLPHHLCLSVDTTGTHLFIDGYEAFSTTQTEWFDTSELTLNPHGTLTIIDHQILNHAPTPRQARNLAPAAEPLVWFAGSHLSAHDTQRISHLTHGSLRLLMKTRGIGQGGVAFQAHTTDGDLTLEIIDGTLIFSVRCHDEDYVRITAPGRWDDGHIYDVVIVCGRGATDIYVDGQQLIHSPGAAFFNDLSGELSVHISTSASGVRLFGEVQSGMIYPHVFNHHQVQRLATVEPIATQALFDCLLDGAQSYRIPSLITTDSGVIIAGADKRVSIANDAPNDIDFVLRRSVDGGRTWQPPRTILQLPDTACVTDSVLLQDHTTGRIFAFLDQFPAGIGQPNAAFGTGFDADGNRIGHFADGSTCTMPREVDQLEASFFSDPHTAPPGIVFQHPSCHLWMLTSDDDGLSWSTPRDLTPDVKEEWMRFCGTSPGNGIQLQRGTHAGRLLIPMYYTKGDQFFAAALYSDDHGDTWHRGESPDLEMYESTLVEASDGSVLLWARNQHPSGAVAHARSTDGGHSWSQVTFNPNVPEIFSQPNALRVTNPDGIIFANASQLLPFRGRGVLRMSTNDGASWQHNRVFNPRHYVYQCMTQLPDGSIGLLWEREMQGLFFSIIPMTWIMQGYAL
ncbi:sialidase family protein [Corynebacterium diphtheriae]|uniref:sialidase family protein n=1 Tax=Corynebacterium diphtheriae TaxID=1717 RepID=UPI00086F3244|nr:sialidase family protein [Corynebacterium diphtheriae]MBG9228520.1 exo-alpha-sialidase [Corynebacterium diphtheriae bv. gravis]MBG9251117.1 exo-alpha-sialidase [Corynebacterium diphtheriae bv. mitis]MBG9255144.1 exo-alpha-sialidase [Corynebacterium diphtheriae bv. mitis]MBG9261963.1 exo-alpha-sialidase [Corynebacterium diphtheriae bv. mitis]MBG9268938.1 exo-alpha-sialidase [Corynebacterium diphtheriae bv. mitis]